MTQCTATSKRTGDRCRAQAVTGRTVCRHHGGRTLVGPASGQFKNGRYSKYLPTRLLERYHEAERDTELLALRAEISLIDARLFDVLKRVDTGESSRIWGKLSVAVSDLDMAQLLGDERGIRFSVASIKKLINAGRADWDAWSDVRSLVQERKALVESERKRLVEAQRMIAVDQAMSVMGLLIEAVRRHVHDRAALRAITDEWARLTGYEGDRAAVADHAIVDAIRD